MAGSVNKVILIGRLGQDPDIRAFQNGGRIANLSLATSESWKDKATGERKEKTQWHRVVVKNDNLINVCERFLKKGSRVYLEGQIETRKYTDKDGSEKYTTEVIVPPFRGEITMLDSKGESGSSGGGSGGGDFSPSDEAPRSRGSFGGGGASDIDDEIPF